jgi:hypothetical protein
MPYALCSCSAAEEIPDFYELEGSLSFSQEFGMTYPEPV